MNDDHLKIELPELSVDDLLRIIGEKDVQILRLTAALQREMKKAREAIQTED
jgi:hypothetical protein